MAHQIQSALLLPAYTLSESETQAHSETPDDHIFGPTFITDAVPTEADVLPPYVESTLPEYSLRPTEPVTLAMYLFKFGFLFPPFWILGIFVLASPLREPSPDDTPAQWMPEKTPEERAALIKEMRRVEVKWAKRCFAAFAVFVALVTTACLATWWMIRQ